MTPQQAVELAASRGVVLDATAAERALSGLAQLRRALEQAVVDLPRDAGPPVCRVERS